MANKLPDEPVGVVGVEAMGLAMGIISQVIMVDCAALQRRSHLQP